MKRRRADELVARARELGLALRRRTVQGGWTLSRTEMIGRYRNLAEVEAALALIARGVFVPKLRLSPELPRQT